MVSKNSFLFLKLFVIMVDYEIVCVGIAFLYGKQDKKDKVEWLYLPSDV